MKKELLWKIITLLIIIMNFFVMGYFSYKYNSLLEKLDYKPNIEVEISPYLKQETFGEYFPMIITNTGDFTFRDVFIGIKSCEMESYEIYTLPLLPSKSEREIYFGNKNVIESFKKLNCYPFLRDDSPVSLAFPIGTKEEISSTGNVCGVCYFNAKIFATYNDSETIKNFNKSIDSQFPYPTEITISISQND